MNIGDVSGSHTEHETLMTTIVNNPPQQPAQQPVQQPPANTDGGNMNGISFLLGAILLIVFGYFFFIYALPRMLPQQSQAPQINVPDKVDVNIKGDGQGQ